MMLHKSRYGRHLPAPAIGLSSLLIAAAPAFGMDNPVPEYVCFLSSLQEVPALNTIGGGGGRFVIDTEANTLDYTIVYFDLTTPEAAAHIHRAEAGTNGGVVHPLPLGTLKQGTWNYPEDVEGDLLAGKLYVNIHSQANPGGELRGQIVPLTCAIDAQQEVPPNGSNGRGFGLFTIDVCNNTLDYYIGYTGLTSNETAAHIHGLAPHGTNAGVKHPLPASNPKVGTWNYAEADEAAILAGLTYVNIHTQNFPGGEIRGQITPIVVPVDGTQEVPPNASPATGIGFISINKTTDVLGFDIRRGPLTANETAAHIHGFAPRGVNAGVKTPLPAGPRKLGAWSYPAADESGILDGLTYINVHSANFGGGEIRGQIEFPQLAPVAALAESFTVVFGEFESGTVEDLAVSDDQYVHIQQRPAFTPLLPLIRFEAAGTSCYPDPSVLVTTIETAATSIPTRPPQKLLLFNYDTSSYELIDERIATPGDTKIDVTIDTNAGRFIEDGTRAVKMRIDWFNPGNVFSPNWGVRIDQAHWNVSP